ncbi:MULTISPECIES: phage tail tape measure protein [Persephonella]|uniref:Putative phage-related membrane protein n=1 Tax=Persephonella marina (strain DSM 14350 / EX-H1) TaxID=123214 RepID=C0QS89_PERMH|nr:MULTISPECIES: phage tail tape measure protein [Persephonella]ACO03494.1 putative phage-related membrane protein [Persephonella marina EX-H1]
MFGADDIFRVGVIFEVIDKISEPLKHIEKVSEEVQKSLDSLYKTSSKLANIGKDLAILGGSITAAFALPVASAIQLEKQVYEFNKVVGASEEQLSKYTEAFIKMSSQIPIATDEIFALSASLSQMGIPKEQLIEFTEMVSKAAFAFDMLPEEAGKAFGEIKNAFAIPTIQALQEVGDTVNYLSNTMGAAAKDIIDILKRVGATAKAFGIEAKYAAVFGAVIKEAGISSEETATSFRTLLTRTQAMDKGFLNVLSAIGMTKDEFMKLKQQNPSEALIKVLDAVKRLDSTKQTQLLKDWVGLEHVGKIQILVNNLDRLKEKIKEVQDGAQAGSMQQEFEALTKSTAAQLQLLWNNIKNIASLIGSVFLPPLNMMIQAFSAILSPIATFINHHKTLASVILLPIGAFGILTLVIGGLLGTIGLLGMGITKGILSFVNLKSEIIELSNIVKKELIPSLNVAIAKLNLSSGVSTFSKAAFMALTNSIKTSVIALRSLTMAAISFVFTPVGAVLTGIAIAGYLVYKNWDKVKGLFKAIYNFLYLDRIKAFWMGFKEGFSDISNAIKPLKDAFSNLARALEPVFQAIAKVFGFKYNPDNSAFIIFARMGILAGKTLVSVISIIAEFIAGLINLITEAIKFGSKLIYTVIHPFETIKEFLKNFNLFDIGRSIIEGLLNGIKSMISKPVEAVKNIGKNIVGGIKEFLGIKSPSKVFMEIGLFALEGLKVGILGKENEILKLMSGLADNLSNPFKESKNNFTEVPIYPVQNTKKTEKKSTTVVIKQIIINTQATNSKEIAQELPKELEKLDWSLIAENI